MHHNSNRHEESWSEITHQLYTTATKKKLLIFDR